MKSITKIFIGSAVFSLLLFTSCSSDDNDPFIANASDITVTIDENPAGGFSIGVVTTNITGTLAYSISSQSVANAFSIDATTGAVTVNDASAFDFETNPALTAAVSVTNSTDTATANISTTLNDIDDIASFLTTSSALYTAAAAGDWVMITEAEYNNLAQSLNDVSKIATSDTDYDSTGGSFSATGGAQNYTRVNANGINMSNGSYVFAFKYHSGSDNVSNANVKQSSTNANDSFTNLGVNLPTHNMGENYFVIKGNDTPTTDTGYLGYYSPANVGVTNYSGVNFTYSWGLGDLENIPNTANNSNVWIYQGLSTTQKQWD